MRERVLARASSALVTLSLAGMLLAGVLIAGMPVAGQPESPALVQIWWQKATGLEAVEAASLPVYAHLSTARGPSLLAAATPAAVADLRAQGLEVAVLDPDLASAGSDGTGYYIAYFPPEGLLPGRTRPEWQRYGQVLSGGAGYPPLQDADHALLRLTPQAADQLAAAGAQLQAVDLQPKPLYALPVDGHHPAAVDPDPVVQAMIDQVEQSTIYDYTGDLSGEWPVQVGGAPYTIETRYSLSTTPLEKATQFAYEHLDALGLDVVYHSYSLLGTRTRRNVIAEIEGTTNPDEVYILCGHLDSLSEDPYKDAPGADDNASGSVGVLIAADILSQYQWSCTLRLALWTGEEQGLHGSAAYAQEAYTAGENIAGVLNLDMLAWNTPDSSHDMDLHARETLPATMDLAQLYSDTVAAYGLDLIPEIHPSGTGRSDHASFWNYGYPAVLVIEDFGDLNPRFHTTSDQLQYLDMDYYTEMVKASLATFVHMSDCLVEGSLEGHVTTVGSGTPLALAQVEFDAGREPVHVLTDSSGYYTVTLPAGTYTVTASSKGYRSKTVSGVAVTSGTVTTQDFALWIAIHLPVVLRGD